jgi:hypothetical protein
MNSQTAARWRLLSRALKIIGVVGFISTFALWMGFLWYYSATRPQVPEPALGRSIGLTWTHPPRYGTSEEEDHLHCLFDCLLPFFGVILLSEAIKIYKLDDLSGIKPLRWPFNKI